MKIIRMIGVSWWIFAAELIAGIGLAALVVGMIWLTASMMGATE